MAVKSIIDIDVNTAAFSRFSALFDKYQEALAKTPSAWAKVSKEHHAVSSNFERVTAALMAQAQLAREEAAADEKQSKHLTQSARLWTSMAKSTKSVAGNIISATTALVKWTGIVGAVGGLLGAGGLFGIDRMAATVAGQRKTGMGLGMSPGEMQAFSINFGRILDQPESFLEQINEMRSNPAEAWRLATLGVSSAGTNADVAVRALDAMRARALATPETQLGLLDRQTGMNQGIDVWRRLHDMSREEFEAQRAHYRADVAQFATSPDTNRNWQDLASQLSRAKTTLFDAFQTRLGQLSPELTHLSDSLTQIGTKIINSPFAKDAVTAIGHGLDWLAEKIDSPEFQQRIDQFFSEDGPIASAIRRFSDAASSFIAEVEQDLPAIAHALHVIAHPLDTAENSKSPVIRNTAKALDWAARGTASVVKDVAGMVSATSERSAFLNHPTKDVYLQRLDELERAYHLPSGLLRWQWQRESSSSFAPTDSAAGAVGPFQIRPIAQADIKRISGMDLDPRDPLQAALGAAEFDRYLLDQYHGDVKKALAAYNWGPDNMRKLMAGFGEDWRAHLPAKETREYVSSYERSQAKAPKPPGINVTVNDNTGGSTHTTVNALNH